VAFTLGTTALHGNDRIANAAEAQSQLTTGAPLRVVVTGVASTRGTAPIAIISAGERYDVVQWAQDGRDALFAASVQGTLMGLRTPWVRISDVIPRLNADTLELSGSYIAGWYRLRAQSRAVLKVRSLRASPSMGWAFMLPLPLFAFGPDVLLLTACWVATLWVAFGYWSSRAMFGGTAAAWGIATAVLGLGVAPTHFGLPLAHWSEWLAALVGGAVGFVVARSTRATV
jgi:hypothetical protein